MLRMLCLSKDNFLDRYDLTDVSHEKLMLDNWNAHIEQFAGIRCNDLQEMYNYHFADHKEFVRLLDAKNTAVILLNHAAFKLYFEINLLLQHLNHSSTMIIHDGTMEKTLNRAEIADLKSAIEYKKFDILSNKYLAIRDNVDKLLIPIVQVAIMICCYGI